MNVLVVRRGVYFERADKIVTNSFLLLFLLFFFFFFPTWGNLAGGSDHEFIGVGFAKILAT